MNILEISERLQFQYLIHNGFESTQAQEEVQRKGYEKLARGEVALEALELGQQFIQEIQEGYVVDASVHFINEQVGYGLFAKRVIEPGDFVGEYTGIVRKNDRRYLEPLNNYCYEYPILDSIHRSYVIDATQGNLTRFINHSFTPNLRPVYAFIDGYYHCIFRAFSLIEKGSQLSYDYGKSYWYIREAPEPL